MKVWARYTLLAAVVGLSLVYMGCNKEEKQPQEVRSTSYTITFEDAADSVVASDNYGSNCYSATADEDPQVTKGYFAKVADDTYVQFPINYAANWDKSKPWSYEFYNGGCAVSTFTNTALGDYNNQMSVYGKGGYADSKRFAVCTGYSDEKKDPEKKYAGCAKIYVTDKTGYSVVEQNKPVRGKAKKARFNSVWVCNTTYAYLVMKNGNDYTNGSLESHKGWFKVVFKALDVRGQLIPDRRVEYYLANFDPEKKEVAGLENQIRDTWSKVDLTPLGSDVAALLVNFEGSDTGANGLNTPAYVAIDNLEVTVAK